MGLGFPIGCMGPMSPWATAEDPDDQTALGLTLIGAGLRAGRLGLGLSQRQLAWRVGLSQSAISRLETGTIQGLRLRTLGRIAGVLEASPGYEFPGGPPAPTRRLPGQSVTRSAAAASVEVPFP